MKLSDKSIRSKQPSNKTLYLSDGGGLYLAITPAGKKSWYYRYRYSGKNKKLFFGAYPEISLSDARDHHFEARKQLANGQDPAAVKKIETTNNSFGQVARLWWEKRKADWSESTQQKTWRRLEKNILPWLKDHHIESITTAEFLKHLRRVEGRGAVDMAHRLAQDLNRIMMFAISSGLATNNTAFGLVGALASHKAKNFPAITEPTEVGALLRSIDAFECSFVVKSALRILPYVFTRPGELRNMTWSEIAGDVWEIPAEKMKMKRPHIVPLSGQVLAILEDIRPLTGDGIYVFPSLRTASRPISDGALNAALRRMGYAKDQMTPHGFRTMASTRLHEMGFKTEVIERQLAHVDQNKVRGVYNKAEYLDDRRKMMFAWADYLDGLKADAQVLPFRKNAEI